jgi:uncharacterized protein (DUF1697 family)
MSSQDSTNIFIAILRGINVSGKNRIKMEELKKSFEAIDCENVKTYVQSGNVVFTSRNTNGYELRTNIEKQIKEEHQLDVPVLIMTLNGLKEVIEKNPFLYQIDLNPEFFHVTFLEQKTAFTEFEKILSKLTGDEKIEIIDNSVYLYCPNGYGNTKLSNTFLEKQLKVRATTRNWRTCLNLLDMASCT